MDENNQTLEKERPNKSLRFVLGLFEPMSQLLSAVSEEVINRLFQNLHENDEDKGIGSEFMDFVQMVCTLGGSDPFEALLEFAKCQIGEDEVCILLRNAGQAMVYSIAVECDFEVHMFLLTAVKEASKTGRLIPMCLKLHQIRALTEPSLHPESLRKLALEHLQPEDAEALLGCQLQQCAHRMDQALGTVQATSADIALCHIICTNGGSYTLQHGVGVFKDAEWRLTNGPISETNTVWASSELLFDVLPEKQRAHQAIATLGHAMFDHRARADMEQLALQISTQQIMQTMQALCLPAQHMAVVRVGMSKLQANAEDCGWERTVSMIDPLEEQGLCKDTVEAWGNIVLGKLEVATLLCKALTAQLEDLTTRLPDYQLQAQHLVEHSGLFVLEHGPDRIVCEMVAIRAGGIRAGGRLTGLIALFCSTASKIVGWFGGVGALAHTKELHAAEDNGDAGPLARVGSLDLLIKKYFHRYDLDDSGTINSCEELSQLTTNLVFKLNLSLAGPTLAHIVDSVGILDDKRCMTVGEYAAWFEEHIITKCNTADDMAFDVEL